MFIHSYIPGKHFSSFSISDEKGGGAQLGRPCELTFNISIYSGTGGKDGVMIVSSPYTTLPSKLIRWR